MGEDALKRQTVLDRLRARAAQLGDLDFNHDVLDCENANGADIVSACNTLPFASEIRLVEASHVEKLSKQDSEMLVAYLSSPNPTTVLALVADKLAKSTRLYKAVAAVGKTSVIDCTPPKRYELAKNIRAMATGHGFTITPSAVEALLNLVGEDTVRIDTELKKLALAHRGTDPVNEHEVMNLVAQTSEPKPWEFTDAFAARNLNKCLSLLPRLTSASPYSLMFNCVSRIRELICAKSLVQRGEQARLADELHVPAWRVKNHVQNARLFSDGQLEHMLSTARDCEKAMKSGAEPNAAFRQWVIESLS